MNQLGEVCLGVVMGRINGKIDNFVSEEQYGLIKEGKGTTNAI